MHATDPSRLPENATLLVKGHVFPDFDVEVMDIRGFGDVTISNVRARGHGQGSTTPFEDAVWVTSRLRDGKVVRWQTFASESEALEAAGLSE